MRVCDGNGSKVVDSHVHQSDTVLSCTNHLSIYLNINEEKSDKYPAKKHARRVALRLGLSRGLIYLVAKPTTLLDDSDQSVPFRQRRYFYYLSGVDEPDCYLTYDLKRDHLILYVPDFDLRHAVWMGHTLTVEEAMKKYDVDEARYYNSLRHDVAEWVQKERGNSLVYILHESQRPRISLPRLKLDSDQLMPAIDACRGIKDEHEISLIRRANEISTLAHTQVLRNIRRLRNEAEVEGVFVNTCFSHLAKNQSYAIIAASGENAAVLHYSKNDESFGDRQMMCLDAGAEFHCYACDVTRTFPLHDGSWPSVEAESIYRAVESMQEECIRRIAPGVRFLDLHLLAHMIAIDKLTKLGILKGGSSEEIRESGASTVFYPHGLGHHVGLEVHDVSEESITAQHGQREPSVYESVIIPYSTLSPCTLSAPVLESGMVVTVEPGIYFSRPALDNARRLPNVAKHIDFDVVARYMSVGGVRIEDDILVTPDGYENLTTAPKGDKALEIIREGTEIIT